MTTTVIKTYQVAPPQGAVVEQSLALTFFDMMWLHFHPMLQLFFFEFPCSKPHFLGSVVPKLHQSLSKALKHFFPFSCNLIYPLSPDKMPEFRYLSGDSVSFTIAESSDDFDNLVANRADSADRLYNFAPKLPPIVEESERKIFQVFAAQVTLFPGRGIGIGIANYHTVADGMSAVAFMTTWASINRRDGYGSGGDEVEFLSIFDRSVVKYPTKLDSIYRKRAQRFLLVTRYPSLPTNRMRATFVFNASEMKKLRDLVQNRISDSIHISSFVAIAAYIWTGIAKSLRAAEVDDDEPTYFIITIGSTSSGKLLR